MFTLDQLAVLDAIDRLGSYTAAARSLHRATSAVSYAVKSLEEAIGITLFDRSAHRAQLTPAGRVVLDEARVVLDRSHGLSLVAERLRDGWEPRLLVVLDGILPMPPMMRALKRFGDAGTPTQIHLIVEYLSGVSQRFRDNEGHLMIVLEPSPHPTLRARAFPPVDMVLVVHPDHPLKRLGRSVRRIDLKDYVELMVEDSGPDKVRQPPLYLGSSHVFRLSDFHSKREALLGGVGFGWLPRHLAEHDLEEQRLVLLGFEEGDTHTFSPKLMYRRDVPLGRSAALFIKLLEEEVGMKSLDD